MFALEGAVEGDFERLLALRLLVMRESLERIGRFDETRARERFRKAFRPEQTRLIVTGDSALCGCVSLSASPDHLTIDFFYLFPEHQNRGLGGAVLRALFAEADAAGLPIRVGVLHRSDAARFYERHGFRVVSEDEWDVYYERAPLSARARPIA
jgi:ribosomal protein S18 acetylase RimI-like enzyme